MWIIKNKRIILGLIVVLFFIGCFFGFDAQAQSFGKASDHLRNIAESKDVDLKTAELPVVIGKIIYGILGLLGVAALVLIIYAGLNWMFADGNPQNIQQAKHTIIFAVVGIIVIALAYAATYYVVTRVIGATEKSSLDNEPQLQGDLGPSGDIRMGHCYCIEQDAAPPDGCMEIPERDNECGESQYCCVFR